MRKKNSGMKIETDFIEEEKYRKYMRSKMYSL